MKNILQDFYWEDTRPNLEPFQLKLDRNGFDLIEDYVLDKNVEKVLTLGIRFGAIPHAFLSLCANVRVVALQSLINKEKLINQIKEDDFIQNKENILTTLKNDKKFTEQVITNLWLYRKRVFPVVGDFYPNFEMIGASSFQPNFVFIDSSIFSKYLLEQTAKVFGNSKLGGNLDYSKEETLELLHAFCDSERRVLVVKNNYWLLK